MIQIHREQFQCSLQIKHLITHFVKTVSRAWYKTQCEFLASDSFWKINQGCEVIFMLVVHILGVEKQSHYHGFLIWHNVRLHAVPYRNRFYPRLLLLFWTWTTWRCFNQEQLQHTRTCDRGKQATWASIYIAFQNILFIYWFIYPNNYYFYKNVLNGNF